MPHPSRIRLTNFSRSFPRAGRPARAPRSWRPRLEGLENRTVLSVTIAPTNINGSGYAGLDFGLSGGYTPPDPSGAAGPSDYVETVNQTIALVTSKSAGSPNTYTSLSNFWFTTGRLARADSGSSLSDPVVTYNDQIGRFIVGDQDVDFNTHVSRFELAVSKTSNPTSLGTSDWTFYQINTTQSGFDADFPGNFGYNHDAFVFTLNMFGVSGGGHVQVVSVSNADLAANSATPHVYQNNLNDFSVRPTTMHDSVAGDPMWLVTEHGDNASIDVIKETGVLSTAPTFAYTNLAVTPYSTVVNPLNPNGTVITNNIDSRIQKSAEWNNTIVAAHSVSVSSTQDVIQWYEIDVSGSSPALKDQGRVSGGNNTYLTYPSIDINASGQIGLTYMRSGTDSSTDYLSTYVTGRDPSDPAGTMESSVLVPAGKGLANYKDFSSGGRAGDLSGINVDPSDHNSFWAVNEFADTESTANWSTAIANFLVSSSLPSTDMAVTISGPPSPVTAGNDVTYTITITNNGPNAAQGVVLTAPLPSGATFVSMTPQSSNPDKYTSAQSGGSVTETANTPIASGSSDTFSLVITVPSNLASGSDFTDTASVQASNPDPNTANNSASATVTVTNSNSNADVSVSVSGPSSANEGDTVTYTITVTNAGPVDATGVTLTNTLPGLVNYTSATTSQGTSSRSGGTVTFTIGTVAAGATVTATVSGQATEDGSSSDSATVSATSPDPTTSNNSASASTSFAEPAVVVSGSISTKNATLTNYRVATFTHANGVDPTSDFVATINWGDGTTSSGTIALSGTTYTVTGSHRYRNRGSHTITTTVTETGNAVDKYDGGDDGHSWKRQDAVQLPSDAHGQGGSNPSPSVDSSAIGAGAAVAQATSSLSSSVASLLASPAANIRPTQTATAGASNLAGGAGVGLAALDPSLIAQGDTNGVGLSPSWGTSGAAWRRRFGGRWM